MKNSQKTRLLTIFRKFFDSNVTSYSTIQSCCLFHERITVTQWSIKELSTLTGLSVRTLHHYDHIGLLKPSGRSANRYRWYSQEDLVRVQQILALKSFGFRLSQIKIMLQHQPNVLEHLEAQEEMLKEQIDHLSQMHTSLSIINQELKKTGSLDWNHFLTLLERYRMAEELKNSWEEKNLNEAQLAELKEIRKLHPAEFALWDKVSKEINDMKLGDPEGPDGERVVKVWIDVAKKTKDSMAQQRHFNSGILKSLKEGKLSSLPVTPEGRIWFSRAIIAYNLKRWGNVLQEIRKNISADPTGSKGKKVAAQWNSIINEIFIGTNPHLAVGIMVWQESGRHKDEINQQKALPAINDEVKKIHAEICFDPEALNWIERALEAHFPE